MSRLCSEPKSTATLFFCQLNISCPTDCSCGSLILFSFSICPFSRGEITFRLWFSSRTVVYPAVQRLARQLYKLTLGTKVWPVLDQWQCFFSQKLLSIHLSDTIAIILVPACHPRNVPSWIQKYWCYFFYSLYSLVWICESVIEHLCAQSSHFWQTLRLLFDFFVILFDLWWSSILVKLKCAFILVSRDF